MKIKKAIIPVAGKGTRFLPATKAIPKEMIPLINMPMLYYVVKEAVDSGIEQIYFITSEGKEAIRDFFSASESLANFLTQNNKGHLLESLQTISKMADFHYIEQKEQLGLGHAVLQAEDFFSEQESFAVLLGDDLTFAVHPVTKQLLTASSQKAGASVIGVMQVDESEVNKYGIVAGNQEPDSNYLKLDHMVEKPAIGCAPSLLASPGRYIFSFEIFTALKNIERGKGGEYQLTDAINLLAQSEAVYAYTFEGERFDTGQPTGYLRAMIEMALTNEEYRSSFLASLKERLNKHGISL